EIKIDVPQQATREIPIVVVSGDPAGWKHHRPIAYGSGDAREVCGIVPRHAAFRATRRRSAQCRGSILETGSGTSPACSAGIEIAPSVMVREASEIDAAFASMKKEGAGAVVVHASLSTKNVADLALKNRLPAATQTRSFAEVG